MCVLTKASPAMMDAVTSLRPSTAYSVTFCVPKFDTSWDLRAWAAALSALPLLHRYTRRDKRVGMEMAVRRGPAGVKGSRWVAYTMCKGCLQESCHSNK